MSDSRIVITFTYRAPEGAAFTLDAWDGNVGKPVLVHVDDATLDGTCRAAVVAPDGLSVDLTIEVIP